MLNVRDAVVGYDKTTILRGVTLDVAAGEVVALLGRNGAGKSTLMRWLVGQATHQGGAALLNGQPLADDKAVRARSGLGYVPQGRFVFPRLSVLENIAVTAVACKRDKQERIDWAMTQFPALRPKARELAGKLSGGQQQMLAIARAMAGCPKVLLLDEPTEGVQPSIVEEIAAIVRRLRDEGLAILVAEQDLHFCIDVSDRACLLNGGRVEREATAAEIAGNQALLHELLGV